MPSTSRYNIPYPGSNEPIAQGAETIRQGTERIDEVLGGGGVHIITNTGQGADSGWGMLDLVQRAFIDGPRISIYLQLRRAGPSVSSPTGGLGDLPLAVFPDQRLRPNWVTPFHLEYISNGATFGGSGAMWPSGTAYLTSITPGTEVTQNQNTGGMSLRAWIHHVKL